MSICRSLGVMSASFRAVRVKQVSPLMKERAGKVLMCVSSGMRA